MTTQKRFVVEKTRMWFEESIHGEKTDYETIHETDSEDEAMAIMRATALKKAKTFQEKVGVYNQKEDNWCYIEYDYDRDEKHRKAV